MPLCRYACVALLILPLAGCRTQPYVNAHIETLNSEYRQLEDYVYCLEEENSRLMQELDALKGTATVTPRSPARGSVLDRARERPRLDAVPADPPSDVPKIELPNNPAPAPRGRSTLNRPENTGTPTLDAPVIEMPTSNSSDGEPTPAVIKPDALPLPKSQRSTEPEPIGAKPKDDRVTHIVLNPVLTGGSDQDGSPGDEALSVLIEPRNAADAFVPQAGAVSVVVLDPAKTGESARVARWDFDLAATQQKVQSASATPGIRLEMPWPAGPPQSNKLQLYVRYETADGRKLQADREIFVALPGEVSRSWTPRSNKEPSTVAAAPPITQPTTGDRGQASLAPSHAPAAGPPKLLSPPPALSGDSKAKPPAWSPYR